MWACRGECCGEQERAEGGSSHLWLRAKGPPRSCGDGSPEVDIWAERPVRAEGQRVQTSLASEERGQRGLKGLC